MSNVLVKHWRLVALVLGIIVLLWVLYLWRTFILPFAIGLILAYLLMPMVAWLESKLPPRNKWPGFRRVISVLLAFLLLICLIAGFLYVVVSAVIDVSVTFVESAPYFIGRSVERVQEWIGSAIEALPIEMSLDVSELKGNLKAGHQVELATRRAKPGDCICGNEVAFYPPLAHVENFAAGVSLVSRFSGTGLGQRWTSHDNRSAYMATFALP